MNYLKQNPSSASTWFFNLSGLGGIFNDVILEGEVFDLAKIVQVYSHWTKFWYGVKIFAVRCIDFELQAHSH